MAVSAHANSAHTVPAETVEKLCPAEYLALVKTCDEKDYSLELLGMTEGGGGDIEYVEVDTAYRALQKAFEQVTGGALLEIVFHDPDEAEREDSARGVIWTVDGVYALTSAGRFLSDKGLTLDRWVTHG